MQRITSLCTILIWLTIGSVACNSSTEVKMTNRPTIAQLELPSKAVLYYENMIINDSDRTGNWRFFIDQNGCFYHARNETLWLTDPAQFESDDPALFWNTSFPTAPQRCFTEEQNEDLTSAIREINIEALNSYYSSASMKRTSSPIVERWTIVLDKSYTITVENKDAPTQLVNLRAKIDQLLAEAP